MSGAKCTRCNTYYVFNITRKICDNCCLEIIEEQIFLGKDEEEEYIFDEYTFDYFTTKEKKYE